MRNRQGASCAAIMGMAFAARALLACALLATIASSALFAPVAFAETVDAGTATIGVWQAYSADQVNGVDKTFEYRLEALTEGAPLPDGAQDGVYSWTMTRDDRATVSVALAEAPAHVYEYRMYQHIEEKKDGYTYDSTVYRVRLHPSYDAAGNATGVFFVYDEAGEVKVPDPGWTVLFATPAPNDEPKPDSSPTNPVAKVQQAVSSLVKTADALDITVFALLAAGSVAAIIWSLRKRRASKRGAQPPSTTALLVAALAIGVACAAHPLGAMAVADDGYAAGGSLKAPVANKVALLQDGSVKYRFNTIQAAVSKALELHGNDSSQSAFVIRVDADFTLESGEAVSVQGAGAQGVDLTITSDTGMRAITRGYAATADVDSLFSVTGGATVRFTNVIVDGGADSSFVGGKYGGLVYASDSGTRVVMDAGSVFRNSKSNGQGGAAYVRNGAAFEMHASAVGENCTANNGGFISVHNNGSAATFVAEDALLRNNSALADGGAIFARGSLVSLSGNTHIYGNTAKANGWAICASKSSNNAYTSVTMLGAASIVDNGPRGDGSGQGGGVYLEADGTDYWNSVGSTLTVSGSPMISSNRWNNGDKANVVVSNRNQIIVGSAGFEANANTGMPAARVGVRIDGHAGLGDQFAVTEGSATATPNLSAFVNDLNALYAGVGYGSNQVLWGTYAPVCKIVHDGAVYPYPTITDAMADANTKFKGSAATIEMLVSNYDFRYEFYYPETIIEEGSGSTVPRNYQGIVCSNPNGVTITKASAAATDGYKFNNGADATCVLNRNLTYTILDGNESIDIFGSMFRVRGDDGGSTLTFRDITLDGSWDPVNKTGCWGRYGSFAFVVGNNHLVLGSGAHMRNAHVAPISTTGDYYATRSGDGGAVCVRHDGSFTMEDGATIEYCSASRNGGAVYFMGRESAEAAVSDKNVFVMEDGARIAHCEAGASGGGVYLGDKCTARMAYSSSDLVGDGSGEVSNARDAGKVAGIADCVAAADGGGLYGGTNTTVGFSGYWELDRNVAGGNGGGLFVGESSTVTLAGYNDDLARVGYNQAVNGGGLYAGDSSMVVMNQEACVLENHATAGDGGGVYLGAGSRLILSGEGQTTRDSKKAYIARNYTQSAEGVGGGKGGGVYAAGDTASGNATIQLGAYTEISQNGYVFDAKNAFDPFAASHWSRVLTQDGGGVYATGGASVLMQENSQMRYNGAMALGGGLVLNEGSSLAMLAPSTVHHNYAGWRGGGVYADASKLDQEYSAGITNNVSGFTGAGVHADDGSAITLAGTVGGNACLPNGLSGSGGWTGGGGVCADWSTVYVTGAVSDNSAIDGGGLLLGNSSKARLSGAAKVEVNKASGSGGGACVFSTGTEGALPVLQLFDSARIANNEAGVLGGGVLVQAGANLVVAGSPVVDGNTAQGSTAAGKANNVHLPTVSGVVNAAGGQASERVQVVASPTDGTSGLTALAKVGIYSETEEAAYERFGESRTLASDGWYAQDKAGANSQTYLHQFYNDRDSSLRGTYGADDEVVWGVSLRVQKQVAGAMANRDKRFAFTFSFSGDAVGAGTPGTGSAATGYQVFRRGSDGSYTAEAAVQLSEADRTVTGVELGDGDYIEFTGLYGDKIVRVNEVDDMVRSAIGGAQRGKPYVVSYATANDYGSYAYSTYIDARADPSSKLADDDWGNRTLVTAKNTFKDVVDTGIPGDVDLTLFLVIAGGLLALATAVFSWLRIQARMRR